MSNMTQAQLNIATWANRLQMEGREEAAKLLVEWLKRSMRATYGTTPVKPLGYNNVE